MLTKYLQRLNNFYYVGTMCGIVCIQGDSANHSMAKQSLQRVIHRGSKHFEIKEFDKLVLGANRLPIQGKDTGKQPIANEDASIRVCQNGEIFNYQELRGELEQTGHVFCTDCDTELRVHLFEEYGPRCVEKIDSEMFAVVIYDTITKKLFVARDALGVKPLYYGYHRDGSMHIASEMKQLTQFTDIKKIYDFPKGYYCYDNTFIRYCSLDDDSDDYIANIDEACERLTIALVEAVKKRVQTDLPIGVFLSGGVDSSLIMEIATRFHDNVTAIILGKPGSLDREYALQFCEEKGYKYHLVLPSNAYREKIDEMIYACESYEPLIISHAFANDMCSKAAKELGLSIVLLGEGADEIFAGYNEFCELSSRATRIGVMKLIDDLAAGHLKRIDRLAMQYTVETRCPFLDTAVLHLGLRIPSAMKIKKQKHSTTTKYILRLVAAQFLPKYIVWRYKIPFANGAGMNVGLNFKHGDGEIAEYINTCSSRIYNKTIAEKFHADTPYEYYHIEKFISYGYGKLQDAERRIVVKDTLFSIGNTLHDGKTILAILACMTQKKFRNDRPYLEKDLYSLVQKAVSLQHPIDCYLLWGASDKEFLDDRDYTTLSYLQEFCSEIQKIYAPGIILTIVLTDEHAYNNGYTVGEVRNYYAAITHYCGLQKFLSNTVFLSNIYAICSITRKKMIDDFFLEQTIDRWENNSLRSLLEKAALKHSIGCDPIIKAKEYYALRIMEKPIFEYMFRNHIFLTYNSNSFQELFPHMPSLYLYTEKKGVIALPWFKINHP